MKIFSVHFSIGESKFQQNNNSTRLNQAMVKDLTLRGISFYISLNDAQQHNSCSTSSDC